MNLIITGATKGIGRAIAEKFASQGFNIAINSRNADDLKKMKNSFSKKYPDIEV